MRKVYIFLLFVDFLQLSTTSCVTQDLEQFASLMLRKREFFIVSAVNLV